MRRASNLGRVERAAAAIDRMRYLTALELVRRFAPDGIAPARWNAVPESLGT
jgi:hypothetical protein